jgi:hypothetical protein
MRIVHSLINLIGALIMGALFVLAVSGILATIYFLITS